MKRLIIGLTAATLMGGGLVGFSAASAQADCPYTGCVDTTTKVTVPNEPVPKGDAATICVKVTTGGSGQPNGRVSIAVVRNRGGFRYIDSKRYDGRTCFSTPALEKRGKYTVRANFEARASSPFRDSDNSTAFKVVKG